MAVGVGVLDAVAFVVEAGEGFAEGVVDFGVEEVFGEDGAAAGIIPTIDLLASDRNV